MFSNTPAILKFLVIVMVLGAVAPFANEVKSPKAPIQAGLVPMISLTPKEELIKFIPCENDAECFRALQSSDLDLSENAKSEEGIGMVAEFVEGPQKGIRVVRKK